MFDTLTGLAPGQQFLYAVRIRRRKQQATGKQIAVTTPKITFSTQPATSVTRTSAVLHATVNDLGAAGLSAAIVWSATGGSQQTTASTPLPADGNDHVITAPVSGLTPGTTYTFDVVVSTSSGPLASCGCGTAFTTVALPATLTVTAPATVTAGQQFTVSAEGASATNQDLGDLTGETTFTITPDGSCTGASCSATTVGPHTVHASDGAAAGTAATTITAAALDHLQLSPATANVCAEKATVGHMEFGCGVEQLFQNYTAEGFDQFGNDLGDVTPSTDFSIPSFDCGGPGCGTHGTVGDVTVTASDGTATGTATLTGDLGTPSCEGTNYDVNNDTSDGCEVADSGVGVGTRSAADGGSAAASPPECDSGTNADINISGVIPSDTRVHGDPAVSGFDPTTGSTPDWFFLTPFVGLCQNNIVMKLTTTGETSAQSNDCYKLTVITDKFTYTAQTQSDGTATIDHNTAGQFSDNTNIDVEVSKTCGTSTVGNVSWTLSGHL